jgi:hypothetical protein
MQLGSSNFQVPVEEVLLVGAFEDRLEVVHVIRSVVVGCGFWVFGLWPVDCGCDLPSILVAMVTSVYCSIAFGGTFDCAVVASCRD